MISVRVEPEAPCAGPERRTGPRRRCQAAHMVRMLARPGFPSFKALVRDVSPQGLGLLLDRPLEPGTMLAIQLRGCRQRGLSCVLTARVRHCTELAEGAWVVGCSLSRRLSQAQFAALM